MVVTMGYSGLRWGETIGLEIDFIRGSELQVEWQLREVNGRFYRLPPKDDSYRSTSWEPCLPVDLPDFLADLIARQIDGGPRQKCACIGQHGGSGRFVFLGPHGGHYPGAATTPAACSAPPATGGTNQHQAVPPG
jgi:hypothetical protein